MGQHTITNTARTCWRQLPAGLQQFWLVGVLLLACGLPGSGACGGGGSADAVEIAEADLHFLDAIGLHQHLSPTRSNGLASMVQQMRLYAAALAARRA